MRKANDMNVNRNRYYLYNEVAPGLIADDLMTADILFDKMWLNENEIEPGMKIIELNSSVETVDLNEQTNISRPQTCGFISNFEKYDEPDVSNYRVNNNNARARRRKILESEDYFDSIYAEFSKANWFNTNSKDSKGNNMRYIIDSNTSSESDPCAIMDNKLASRCETKYPDHGVDTTNDCYRDYDNCNTMYETKWSYPLNNSYLSDNLYELVNIIGNDSSNNSVHDNTEIRLGSPMPPLPCTFVPNLNTSMIPRLSTVTEITEPKKVSRDITPTSSQSSETCSNKVLTNVFGTIELKTGSIINWMALSPRDKGKCRTKNVESCELQTEREVSIFSEEKVNTCTDTSKTNDKANKIDCDLAKPNKCDIDISSNRADISQESSKNSTKLLDNWTSDTEYNDKKDFSVQVEIISRDTLTAKFSCVSRATQFNDSQDSYLLHSNHSSLRDKDNIRKVSIMKLLSYVCCCKRIGVNNTR